MLGVKGIAYVVLGSTQPKECFRAGLSGCIVRANTIKGLPQPPLGGELDVIGSTTVIARYAARPAPRLFLCGRNRRGDRADGLSLYIAHECILESEPIVFNIIMRSITAISAEMKTVGPSHPIWRFLCGYSRIVEMALKLPDPHAIYAREKIS